MPIRDERRVVPSSAIPRLKHIARAQPDVEPTNFGQTRVAPHSHHGTGPDSEYCVRHTNHKAEGWSLGVTAHRTHARHSSRAGVRARSICQLTAKPFLCPNPRTIARPART